VERRRSLEDVVGTAGFAGQRVLVTGAQGFIGSWLAGRLLDEGAEVHVLVRAAPEPSLFRLLELDRRTTPLDAQLDSVDALRRCLEEAGVGSVFHLAARTAVGEANRSPVDTFDTNVRGTWNLLEACRLAEHDLSRIVVASTDKAYGPQDRPFGEDDCLRPRYPYDVSKACADMVARSYAEAFEMPIAVTRLGNVYGGGDFELSRLVPGTVRALLAGERPVIRSDGRMERDFLYVEDAVAAYLAVARSLDSPDMAGRAWNASVGEPVAVIDVVRALVAISGTAVEVDVRGEGVPHGELHRQWLDSSVIREELGWRPGWSLDRGLEATYRWYEQHADVLLPTSAG
jgi:CDP-glucose 4,6-dehydratase